MPKFPVHPSYIHYNQRATSAAVLADSIQEIKKRIGTVKFLIAFFFCDCSHYLRHQSFCNTVHHFSMVFQMQAVPLFLHFCDKTSCCHVVFTCDYYSMLYIIHCRMFDWSSDSVHFEQRMNYVYYAPLSVANVMM